MARRPTLSQPHDETARTLDGGFWLVVALAGVLVLAMAIRLAVVPSGGGSAASSPIAAKVELHEVSTDATGMTGMQPIDHLDIHADETVQLKPGSFHLMVMGLTKELTVGDTIELELVFENAGKITVKAEVRQG